MDAFGGVLGVWSSPNAAAPSAHFGSAPLLSSEDGDTEIKKSFRPAGMIDFLERTQSTVTFRLPKAVTCEPPIVT